MHLSEDDIIATASVTESLMFINNALIDNGNHAVIFKPYYPQYLPRQRVEGGKALFGRYMIGKEWHPNIDALRSSLRKGRQGTKYMMIPIRTTLPAAC